MRSLLLKDLLNLRQLLRIWLLIAAVWIAAALLKRDPSYVGGLLVMLVVMVPFNALAYDEASKWESYGLTMPVTRQDMVLSKYALTLLCALASWTVTLLCGLLLGESFIAALDMSLAFVGAGLCVAFVFLPIVFRFGAQKARVIMLLFILIPVLAALLPGSESVAASFFTGVFGRLWLLAPIALALCAASCACSLYIYNRREF